MPRKDEEYKNYINEKEKFAYDLFQRGESFKKARAIVVKGDKLVVLKYSENEYLTAGGGVDEGETLEEAVEREALEELGVKCKARKEIYAEYYQAPCSYNGVDFISKREAHFFICDFISYVQKDKLGLDGEFEDGIEVSEIELCDIDKLKATQELKDKILANLKQSGILLA